MRLVGGELSEGQIVVGAEDWDGTRALQGAMVSGEVLQTLFVRFSENGAVALIKRLHDVVLAHISAALISRYRLGRFPR